MIPTTQETLSQARRWVRVPWDAGPWDVEIARLCITQTEQRVDATLGHRSSAWWATVEQDHWEAYRAWLVAHHTMIQAWADQDAPALAQACVDWWHMTRQLADAKKLASPAEKRIR
ncbi:hypothetical protein SAMN00768000_0234 [Sulfobacillus thermosulfidooxidans DSM 9293]|uniref:Uncharacterized protein n=1 Tax=Sulfobacillus thermosulfidooxidans (strain DSM 9293 / VKM B-1269 / AT-1) TaxID=929705 RepID=A0A1W1W6Y4_SULTA|nr:hypothetical protein [Sulfobacillus thermosulfidooxidans]SMC02025.1 hypothetical protein SAMN00768000_0234 [Sulfobacillus thermosulfidooxidans DSM 9293]